VKACVLIVDDHAIIRGMLHTLFEAHGMQVCEVENGAHGVQKAQDLNPALVILDLSMPVMNGLEASAGVAIDNAPRPPVDVHKQLGAAMANDARHAGILCSGLQIRRQFVAVVDCPRENSSWVGRAQFIN
jgi:CheY-like chemotaxis protein